MSADVAGFAGLKAVLNGHGHVFETCALDTQVAQAVSGELALPRSFVSLYQANGPVERSSIPWVVEDLLVFAFSELPAAQAGYRWIGVDRATSTSWQSNWVVVASVFGDPFLIDTSAERCPVLFARHDDGAWSPTEVAVSMEAFLEALAAFEQVLLGRFALDVWGDDGLLPQFVEDVERELAGILGANHASRFAGLLA